MKVEGVRLVQSARAIKSCKKIGKVNTKIVIELVFSGDAEKVAGELTDLTRNESALMGSDTILSI